MPYEAHPSCRTPADDTVVWRYTSLEKLLDLLHTRELHFARLDRFTDPWEACSPDEEITAWEVDGQVVHRSAAVSARSLVFASPWHRSRYESDALWRLYSADSCCVAIRSTIGAIKDALRPAEDPVHIGSVLYFDPTRPPPWERIYDLALRKRRSFVYEREVRLVRFTSAPRQEARARGDADLGESLRVPVDVGHLIHEVRVSPLSPSWSVEGITAAVRALGYEFPVAQSRLYAPPPADARPLKITREEAVHLGLAEPESRPDTPSPDTVVRQK